MRTLNIARWLTCLLPLACSCTDDTLELKGQIVDNHTKAGIPFREVIVQALENKNNVFVPVYIGEFATDSLGIFTWSLKRDRAIYLYNFSCIGDSAYSYKNIRLGLTELIRHGRFLVFELDRLTELTISLESTTRRSTNESVFLTWISDGKEGSFLYPYKVTNHGSAESHQGLHWTGGDVRSEIRTRVFADKTAIVRCEIFRYGKMRTVADTLLCRRDVANRVSFTY